MIFLDASVLLAAEDHNDDEHQSSLTLLRRGDLATADLALYETTNVAIRSWHDPDAAARLRMRVWAIAELGTLLRVDEPLSEDIARLCVESGLGSFDAAYVAGARRLGVGLCSCDLRDLVGPGFAQLPSTLVNSTREA